MKKGYKTFTKEQGFKVINQLFKGAKITKDGLKVTLPAMSIVTLTIND